MVASPDELKALAAQERWADFANLLDNQFFALLLTDSATVNEAFRVVPESFLEENPRYLIGRELAISSGVGSGLPDESASRRYMEWVANQPHPAARDTLGVLQSQLRFLNAVGRYSDANTKADEVLETIDNATDTAGFLDINPVVLMRVGMAKLNVGDVEGAVACFADASRWASVGEPHPVWAYTQNYLAVALAVAGDFSRAKEHVQVEAARRNAPQGTLARTYETAGILAAGMIALASFDAEQTWASLRALEDEPGELWWLAAHLYARAALYWGDREEAISRLEGDLLYRRTLAGPTSIAGMMVRSDLASLYEALGNLAAASHVLDRRQVDSGHPVLLPSRARLDLLVGRDDEALSRLAGAETIVSHRDHASAALLTIKAAAERRLGDEVQARSTIEQAAGSVLRTGALHMVAEAPPEIRHDVARLSGVSLESLPDVYPPADDRALLTPREQEVLHALEDHDTVKKIAGALHVSPNTAKSHLRSLYRKLSVHTREQALRRTGLRHD